MAYAAEGLGIKLNLLLMANSTLTTACRVFTLNCEGFTRNSVYVNDLLNMLFYVSRKLGCYTNRQIGYAACILTI